MAWVARDDVAAVTCAVLTGAGHDGRTYDVTGPAAHGFAYAAAELSKRAGRLIAYVEEPVEEAYASRAAYGAPAFAVDGWVSSYLAVAAGELEVVPDTVWRAHWSRAPDAPRVSRRPPAGVGAPARLALRRERPGEQLAELSVVRARRYRVELAAPAGCRHRLVQQRAVAFERRRGARTRA